MDFFDDFQWHSSTGINDNTKKSKIIKRLPKTAGNLSKFVARDGGNFLIHKSSRALWKFSEDGNYIESVFDDDVLTDDNF